MNADECPSNYLKYRCPCCGYYTFSAPANHNHGDICPVCFWENDAFIKNATEPSLCNHGKSLRECRVNFKSFGACVYEMLRNIRPPAEDELLGWDEGVDF